MSDSRIKGLLRLQRLRELSEANEVAMDRKRPRFEYIRRSEPTRTVSAFNLFQTPEPIALQMSGMLDLRDDHRVLEPSAGLGRLYKAIRFRKDSHVTLIDSNPDCCRELYLMTEPDTQSCLLQRDFLAVNPQEIGLFDRIIMNPPFKRGTDITHIEHARQFLAPGGRLVALCSAGPRQAKKYGDHWEMLPAGSFKSEGTSVNVAIVTINKE